MTAPTIPTETTAARTIADEQAAALRAGLALLAMVDTVPLDLFVDARRPVTLTTVQLGATIGAGSGEREDTERLAGFRAVVELLGLTVDVYDGGTSDRPTVHAMADTSIAGTPVHLWIYLTDPDVVTAARQVLTTAPSELEVTR